MGTVRPTQKYYKTTAWQINSNVTWVPKHTVVHLYYESSRKIICKHAPPKEPEHMEWSELMRATIKIIKEQC
jgi:hypothetical protein